MPARQRSWSPFAGSPGQKAPLPSHDVRVLNGCGPFWAPVIDSGGHALPYPRTVERWFHGSRLPLTLRDWTDLDGRHWWVRLETGPPPVVSFHSECEVVTVVVDFTDGFEDRSDAALERLLDDGRG